jgi:hypothetical protein
MNHNRACIIFVLLGIGLKNALDIPGENTFAFLMRYPIGDIEPWLIMYIGAKDNVRGLIETVMMANVAQFILALVYFAYNNLFTRMYCVSQYGTSGRRKKSVHISSKPLGAKRRRHILQLPYRLVLPLLCISGFLHWLVSQSIFFVVIDTWSYVGAASSFLQYTGSRFSCGFSPLAIIIVLATVALMILLAVWMGSRRINSDIPVAGACSAAISAACHSRTAEVQQSIATFKEVRWGAIGTEHGIAACAFTGAGVSLVEVGMLYG